MAAKGSKKHSRIGCLFLKSCFGCSQQLNMEKSDDDEKFVKLKSGSGAFPITKTSTYDDPDQQIINSKEQNKMLELNKGLYKYQEMDPKSQIDPKSEVQESRSNPTREKPVSAVLSRAEKAGQNDDELKTVDEFDPIIGALLMMVTLLVMLIWGQVCAIIFTAAWLYFIPRLGANKKKYLMNLKKYSSNHNVDFDSREYKKKVILEGLLERNKQL